MSCPQCFQGHEHSGEPTGVVSEVHGLQTYIATPPTTTYTPPQGTIVVVPDAFGWNFVNNRLLADDYASQGNYLVYLPDFMNNRPAPLWLLHTMAQLSSPDMSLCWVWKPWYTLQLVYGVGPFFLRNRFGLVWPRIRSFFEAVRKENPDQHVGAAGFCWGGRPVLNLAHREAVTADGQQLVDAVFTGHPSALSLPSDARKVVKPVAVAIGDNDAVTTASQLDIMRATWEKLDNVATEIVLYPGAGHGFCVRVDPHNSSQVQQSQEAVEQALTWFRKHLV